MRQLSSTVNSRNHRLIDFIFQDTPEDQLDSFRTEAKQGQFWTSVINWVYKK